MNQCFTIFTSSLGATACLLMSAAPVLAGPALERFERALAVTRMPRQPYDQALAESTLDQLLATTA